MEEENLFLGLDLSTQSLKGVIMNEKLNIILIEKIIFEQELTNYNTKNGVLNPFPGVYTSPTLMFIEALDFLLKKLIIKIDLKQIKSISVSGQQHGTIYWSENSENFLRKMDYKIDLKQYFEENKMFSIENGPIWMDSSTTEYCKELENQFGRKRLIEITGSKAYERFSGLQIMKIYKEKPEIYNTISHISLISSFLTEILVGRFLGIDYTDLSGTNFFDINTKEYNKELLTLIGGSTLHLKFGNPVEPIEIQGYINEYFIKKFNFSDKCVIISGSGDNPCSILGLGVYNENILGISLGTSDTIFALNNKSTHYYENGHLFVSPIKNKKGNYYLMNLGCIKNGAFIREKIKSKYCENSWEVFENIIEENYLKNKIIFGFMIEFPEISPPINTEKLEIYFDLEGNIINDKELQNSEKILSLIISKALSIKLLSKKFNLINLNEIYITGGGMQSKGLIRAISDVFNLPVYGISGENSENAAGYGACIKAFHGFMINKDEKFDIKSIYDLNNFGKKLLAQPEKKKFLLFEEIEERFEILEKSLIDKYKY